MTCCESDMPEAPVSFELEMDYWPVSSNALHAPMNGGIVLTTAARQYYWQVAEMLRVKYGCKPMLGRIRADVWFHESDLRKRDINNFTKSLFDALESGKVFEDDSQIDETHLYRGELRSPAQIRIKLTQIDGPIKRKTLKKIDEDMKNDQATKKREQQKARTLKRCFGKLVVEDLKSFELPEPTPSLKRVRQLSFPALKK